MNRTGLRTKWMVALGIVAFGAAMQVRADGIPTQTPLTYSGVLQDSAGNPITAAQNMVLTLWDDASSVAGANLKCTTPSQVVTPDAQGRFRILLDQTCFTAVRGNPNLWVQLQVGVIPLARSKINAVPYAIEAGSAQRQVLSYMTKRTTTNGLYCGSAGPSTGMFPSQGGLVGYRAGKSLCEQSCLTSTAHQCFASEAITSFVLGMSVPSGWVIGSFDAPAPGYQHKDCSGFKSQATDNYGQVFDVMGVVQISGCQGSGPILCCD